MIESFETTPSERVELETPFGRIVGVRRDGAESFRSIPYAAPPLGPRRWAPPEPPKSWGGVIDGTWRGPAAPQLPSRLRFVVGHVPDPQDEDCLRLSVFRPARRELPLPVFVWFHGGGWVAGSGELAMYDGFRLAEEQGIIVVNVGYRLGALGFLSHPEIGEGNWGLYDQLAALRWVHANIASFDGDPARITVGGQSAGALSAAAMLAHDDAVSMIEGGILQSTPFGIPPLNKETAAEVAEYFLAAADIPEGPDRAARARSVPLVRLLAAQDETLRWFAKVAGPPAVGAIAFRPVEDGNLVPRAASFAEHLLSACAARRTLVGSTRDEMTAFYGPAARTDDVGIYETEAIFRVPTLAWADGAARAGTPCFAYRFEWQANQDYGACHCLELPLLFGTAECVTGTDMMHGADLKTVEQISRELRGFWGSFIRIGAPTSGGMLWPTMPAGASEGMRFTAAGAAPATPAC